MQQQHFHEIIKILVKFISPLGIQTLNLIELDQHFFRKLYFIMDKILHHSKVISSISCPSLFVNFTIRNPSSSISTWRLMNILSLSSAFVVSGSIYRLFSREATSVYLLAMVSERMRASSLFSSSSACGRKISRFKDLICGAKSSFLITVLRFLIYRWSLFSSVLK